MHTDWNCVPKLFKVGKTRYSREKKFRPEKFLLMIHVSVPVYYKGSFFEKITCCIDDNVCIIFYVKFHFKFSQLANTLEIQHINL